MLFVVKEPTTLDVLLAERPGAAGSVRPRFGFDTGGIPPLLWEPVLADLPPSTNRLVTPFKMGIIERKFRDDASRTLRIPNI